MDDLRQTADKIIAVLSEDPAVRKCGIYGSLMTNTHDELSDIDIEIDVSGYDNGQFMLGLVDYLKDKLDILYRDYEPSLVPEKYIVSIAIDENDPFRIVDLSCCAKPHCTSVTRQQTAEKNDKYTHMLKLWTANLKHYARGVECRGDIVRMAGKIGVKDMEYKSEAEILDETLRWIEENVRESLRG